MRSLSRIPIRIEVSDKGYVEAEFARHLAPSTVSSLLRHLPLSGRAAWLGDFLYIVTGLALGAEKQRREFKEGELAFMVLNGGVGVFLKDMKGVPMNPVGRVISGLSILKGVKPGDTLTFRR